MTLRKQIDQVTKDAEKRGWKRSTSNGGHIRMTHPTHGVVFSARTPGCYTAITNFKAQLRRAERGRGRRRG